MIKNTTRIAYLIFIIACSGCVERDSQKPDDGRLFQCSQIRAVTSGPGNDSEAVWSPDGQQIAFQTDRKGDLDIAVVDLANGSISMPVERAGHACYPAWTPDGALVYAFGHHAGTAVQAAAMKADCGYGLRLWREGQTQVLTQGYWRDYTPSVSPDGTAVYYASTRDEKSGDSAALWRRELTPDATGDCVYRLGQQQGGAVQPSLSPDGQILLWAQLNNFRKNWRLCAALTTNLSDFVYLTSPEMSAYAPRWSPDGRFVTFSGFRTGDPCWGIYVQEACSGEMMRLETGPGVSRSPAWSPDGRELVFENNRTGYYKLYRTRVTRRVAGAEFVCDAIDKPEFCVEARLERNAADAELILIDGTRLVGIKQAGKALKFEQPAGLDFGTNTFFVRTTMIVNEHVDGSHVAVCGQYKEHAMGWQVFVSKDDRIWFHARNPQGTFIGVESDEPVTFGRPVSVLGVREADGTVRLCVDGKLQKTRGKAATMDYGPALSIYLGQQSNGGMRFNGQVLSFECGRGMPADMPREMSRDRLFGEVTP
ncbi:MAG: hypothetical protein PF904_11585 [Kiritimatiellae bacterium]|jgi:Tol biopolymer transport system component|nr:hypothetical protein [Kiritimatiellia bacterium]